MPTTFLALLLNFLVVMRYKLGDDHAAARQEVFHCLCCFIFFHLACYATGDATTFAAGLTSDLSVD